LPFQFFSEETLDILLKIIFSLTEPVK